MPDDVTRLSIEIEISARMQAELERLVQTGLYGTNPAEAAERLLARAIEDRRERGLFDPPEDWRG